MDREGLPAVSAARFACRLRRGLLGLLLGACLCPAAARAGPEPAVRDRYFGLHIHRAADGSAWPAAEFGSWRLWDAQVAWPDLQPARERWDFSRLDRYLAMARLAGVDVLLPLGMSPTWASARPQETSSYGPGWAAEPAHLDDWRRYVRTVAERYRGQVHVYDLWNEVNEKGFYSGSVETLVTLACEAHRILHAVSPVNRLVSPSLVGAGREPQLLESFLRQGGGACVDIIGYHFYVPHREPEEIVALVRRVRAAAVAQGLGHLPVWNTESGWWMENGDGMPQPEVDRSWRMVRLDEGPAVLARTLILGRWAGLQRFYWYAWDNRNLGLVEPSSGKRKPAAVAFRTLIGWMQHAVPQCAEQRGRWLCSLPDRAGQRRRIAWQADGRAGLFALPPGERLLAVEQLDGRRAAASGTEGTALGPEPVLIVSTPQDGS